MALTIVANSTATFRQKNPVVVRVRKTCRRNASHLHHAPRFSLPALFQLGEKKDTGISPGSVRSSGRDPQGSRRLCRCEPGKKTQFDQLCRFRVLFGKKLERLVKSNEI